MAKHLYANTPALVAGYLKDALDIVRELELDDDLGIPAFLKAVDLLAAKQVIYTQAEMTPDVLPATSIPRGNAGH